MQEYLPLITRLLVALAAGSIIGLERAFHGRPAGLRTHALVSTASCLLMLLTAYQWELLADVPVETIRVDPTRMAQGIMTGIGFLGAGVIMKEKLTVRGLTTAPCHACRCHRKTALRRCLPRRSYRQSIRGFVLSD